MLVGFALPRAIGGSSIHARNMHFAGLGDDNIAGRGGGASFGGASNFERPIT